MNQSVFERRIKPIFLYIGFIASIIFSIAYVIVVAVMIMGLEAAPTIETFVGFLIANLVAGACIAISLMIQGQEFAKNIPENKKIVESYMKKPEVKVHSMAYYWTFAILRVIFTRLLLLAAMTYIVIDICWQGNGQYTYFLMAFFNILMFFGFGSLGMVSMYDKFNTRYIPWILKQKGIENEGKVKEAVEETPKDSTEQRNAILDNDNRVDILEPVNSDGNNGTDKSVLLDSVRGIHGVLGGSMHTSNTHTATDGKHAKKDI